MIPRRSRLLELVLLVEPDLVLLCMGLVGIVVVCVAGCGSVELAAAVDAGAADAGLEEHVVDAALERAETGAGDADEPERPIDPLPLQACAGLVNPGPVDVVACSDSCATCTSSSARLVDCRFDGHRMCVATCSACP